MGNKSVVLSKKFTGRRKTKAIKPFSNDSRKFTDRTLSANNSPTNNRISHKMNILHLDSGILKDVVNTDADDRRPFSINSRTVRTSRSRA